MITLAVKNAKKAGKWVGVCGDAPSSIPGYVDFLIKLGIDSISLSQDAFIRTKIKISEAEKKHRKY